MYQTQGGGAKIGKKERRKRYKGRAKRERKTIQGEEKVEKFGEGNLGVSGLRATSDFPL